MFDVGFWEILLILVLALVVIGPERLPGAARKAGYFVGKARRYVEGVRSEVESELDIGEFKRMLHNQEVQINELQQQLKEGASDLTSDIKSDLPDDVSVAGLLNDTPAHSFHDEVADVVVDEAADEARPTDTKSDTSNTNSLAGEPEKSAADKDAK
jgi:sec-independent protein translocase protein TatB